MQISKAAILALKGTDKEAKKRIASAVGVEVSTVYRWINQNHINLTHAASLDAITKEIGLPEELILERETINEETTSEK